MNASRWILASILAGGTACDAEPDAPARGSEGEASENAGQVIGYDLRRLRPNEKKLSEVFDAQFARSLEEGKRVAVFFSAQWCAPCRRLEVEFGNAYPADQIGDVRIFELKEEDWKDAMRMDEFNGLRRRWYAALGSYPLVILLDAEGNKVEEMKEAKERLEAVGVDPTLPNWFSDTRVSG